MPWAIGYLRVSTAEQAREGVSLDAQRARIQSHCTAQGYDLAAIYSDEGISGRRTVNRPGLEQALQHTCKFKGSLIVYSLSRLARSTSDAIRIAERLHKSEAQLVMLAEQVDTNSAAGRMFYTVLAALAAFESDQISERVRLVVCHKRDRGERYSKDPPYGYFYVGGRLERNPDEQSVLQTLSRLHLRGSSFRQIAAQFEARGIRNRKGNPFPFQHLARLAQRSTP